MFYNKTRKNMKDVFPEYSIQVCGNNLNFGSPGNLKTEKQK